MNKTILYPFIRIFAFVFLLHHMGFAQRRSDIPPDSVAHIVFDDTTVLWLCMTDAAIFRSGQTTEIWKAQPASQMWHIDEHTRSWNVRAWGMRFWLTGDSLFFWTGDERKKAELSRYSDSLAIWRPAPEYCVVRQDDTVCVWQTIPYTFFWQIDDALSNWHETDTTHFSVVNDSVLLWQNARQRVLWRRATNLLLWSPGASAAVWVLNDSVEVWKTGAQYNIWTKKRGQGSWEKNTTVPLQVVNDSLKVWKPDVETRILVYRDTITIWKEDRNSLVYSILPDLSACVWELPPPLPKPVMTVDTLVEQAPRRRSARRNDLSDQTRLWEFEDGSILYQARKELELWSKTSDLVNWQVDDSTLVWTVGGQFALLNVRSLSVSGNTMIRWPNGREELLPDPGISPIILHKAIMQCRTLPGG